MDIPTMVRQRQRQRQQAWQQAGEAEHFYVSDRARARVDAEIIDTIENNDEKEQA